MTDVVEAFNTYFCTVFTHEDLLAVPTPKIMYSGLDTDKLVDVQFSPTAIEKYFSKLRIDKSPGVDGLSPGLLRYIGREISVPLCIIFQLSLNTASVPQDWKLANVSPIFKKGNRHSADNYRPVSLTSLISKCMETVLRDHLVQHLEKHKLVRGNQHGFRSGHSCLTNLLVFMDSVTSILDSNNSADAIYLDMAKAFDKVPHMRLLLKLRAHGVDGKLYNWIEAWLTDRYQRVMINGVASSWQPILSGVPQGSVLGPLLFLIFINDLGTDLACRLLMFADDTKLFARIQGLDDGLSLQHDLDSVSTWADIWQMKFNESKCKVMHFGSRNVNYQYSINNQ
jgi:hypothetical protein